jgi:glycerol kinase
MIKILAIDQGTTSSRAIVFSDAGEALQTAQKELTLVYPQNGWVEQNPDDILNDTLSCVRECLAHHEDIVAIGITNQRETTIIWDRETGKPIYNAIVWQDRRTADYCASLKSHEAMVRQKTGLLLDPYFSATKIHWILSNVEGARAAAEQGKLAFGTVDSFLLWHLTGRASHITDMSNASRTMLFNINTLSWDDDLLRLFDIPKSLLPEARENVGNFGVAHIDDKEIRIMGMAGDQQAALIGQACFDVGMMKSTYGTGCFALMNIGNQPKLSRNKLLTSVGYVINGNPTYVLEGSIFVAGAALQWLRDEMAFFTDTAESEAQAKSVTDSDGVYFIPAFTGLGAPYWNPNVRGAILGLTRATSKAHITRAALEAQAYQTCDLMGAMVADSGTRPPVLRVDGGLVRNTWMVQFLSDMLDVPIEIPKSIETTALGAAYLAGIGAGVFKDVTDISKKWERQSSFVSGMSEQQRKDLYAGWKKSVERLL